VTWEKFDSKNNNSTAGICLINVKAGFLYNFNQNFNRI
jgi:hypothetical protein